MYRHSTLNKAVQFLRQAEGDRFLIMKVLLFKNLIGSLNITDEIPWSIILQFTAWTVLVLSRNWHSQSWQWDFQIHCIWQLGLPANFLVNLGGITWGTVEFGKGSDLSRIPHRPVSYAAIFFSGMDLSWLETNSRKPPIATWRLATCRDDCVQ